MKNEDLLLNDFHNGVFDVVGEICLLEAILKVLFGGFKVFSVGIGAWTQDLHHTSEQKSYK